MIVLGRPDQAILAVAEEVGAALIVLGVEVKDGAHADREHSSLSVLSPALGWGRLPPRGRSLGSGSLADSGTGDLEHLGRYREQRSYSARGSVSGRTWSVGSVPGNSPWLTSIAKNSATVATAVAAVPIPRAPIA
jgi:hypothetical protein